MEKQRVIIDVNVASDVASFDAWLQRWRSDVQISDDEGCGCCVHIWEIDGPQEAMRELPAHLLEWKSPEPPGHRSR